KTARVRVGWLRRTAQTQEGGLAKARGSDVDSVGRRTAYFDVRSSATDSRGLRLTLDDGVTGFDNDTRKGRWLSHK
uniref:Uncharacterized protein n=1 Tax=Cucumis melo TaxID=3656 RepID=A0A9I9DW51_CUCME